MVSRQCRTSRGVQGGLVRLHETQQSLCAVCQTRVCVLVKSRRTYPKRSGSASPHSGKLSILQASNWALVHSRSRPSVGRHVGQSTRRSMRKQFGFQKCKTYHQCPEKEPRWLHMLEYLGDPCCKPSNQLWR